MTATAAAHRPRRARPPGRAFQKLLTAESRLALRAPVGLVFGVALPLLLLVVFGSIPVFRHPIRPGSTLTVFQVYIPVLICLSLALLALISLPVPLATHRQLGVLRRFAATPAPPTIMLMNALIRGDWPHADASERRHQSECSGLVAAYLQWHLEHSIRSLRHVEHA